MRNLWSSIGSLGVFGQLIATSTTAPTASQEIKEAGTLLYGGPALSDESWGVNVGADYILWQISQEGLETAGCYYVDDPILNPIPAFGLNFYPKFGMRSGFKSHVAVNLDQYENVDLFLEYMWLQTSTYGNQGELPPYSVDYVHTLPTSSYVHFYNSTYKFAYNVLDFEIGRLSSFAKDSFNLRPFFGIRGVWNTSTWAPSTIFVSDEEFEFYEIFTTSNQTVRGAGVRAGFDMTWQFYPSSSEFGSIDIFSTCAASGVYGNTSVRTMTRLDPADNLENLNLYSNVKSSLNRTIPVIDLSFGLGWNINFGGAESNDYNLELHTSWDTQTWINYGKSQVRSQLCLIKPQTLSVQGLTVGGSLTF